ncbi:hypothetical protein LENED_001563 [Lentinula edodes]|uniref:Uncharacterized protein n=1 Tax=Lentinula edodes TaxID=5353 RepID=A0A1Q3DYS6_LENED|nr:hypothetical protein LENED_001563 [Lentinula edodes]
MRKEGKSSDNFAPSATRNLVIHRLDVAEFSYGGWSVVVLGKSSPMTTTLVHYSFRPMVYIRGLGGEFAFESDKIVLRKIADHRHRRCYNVQDGVRILSSPVLLRLLITVSNTVLGAIFEFFVPAHVY